MEREPQHQEVQVQVQSPEDSTQLQAILTQLERDLFQSPTEQSMSQPPPHPTLQQVTISTPPISQLDSQEQLHSVHLLTPAPRVDSLNSTLAQRMPQSEEEDVHQRSQLSPKETSQLWGRGGGGEREGKGEGEGTWTGWLTKESTIRSPSPRPAPAAAAVAQLGEKLEQEEERIEAAIASAAADPTLE